LTAVLPVGSLFVDLARRCIPCPKFRALSAIDHVIAPAKTLLEALSIPTIEPAVRSREPSGNGLASTPKVNR
jgi:hypothetical protein